MDKDNKRKITLFILDDEQIATRRLPTPDSELRVSTQMCAGCSSEKECDKLGGDWEQDKNGKYYCSGTHGYCKDSGTGDWD